jgi:hypothetical protein
MTKRESKEVREKAGKLRWLENRRKEEHAAREKYAKGEQKYPELAPELKEVGGDESSHEKIFENEIDRANGHKPRNKETELKKKEKASRNRAEEIHTETKTERTERRVYRP